MAHTGADSSSLNFDAALMSSKSTKTASDGSGLPFQDELHQIRTGQLIQNSTGRSAQLDRIEKPYLVAAASPDPGGDGQSRGGGTNPTSFLSYAGDITYVGLISSAFFQHDDPLQLQTRATRYFQEMLGHHAINNPETARAAAQIFATEHDLAGAGAKFKAIKPKVVENEAKHESKEEKKHNKEIENDARNASAVVNDIHKGLRSPDDYLLAARFMYMEAINKADERSTQEAKDHKDEKRLLDELKWLSGEPDRVTAYRTRHSQIDPLLEDLGASVSYRFEAADFLERYGKNVTELGWMDQAKQMRDKAQEVYDHIPNELVRESLKSRYPSLVNKPAQTGPDAQA